MALYDIVTPQPTIRIPSFGGIFASLKQRIAAHIVREREIRALRGMSDRDLSDLAIGRSEIAYAVDNGR